MTIHHVVIMNFKHPLEDAAIKDMRNAVIRMMEDINAVKSYECGFDIGLSGSGGQSFSLTARFDSVDGYRAYASHPSHINYVKTYVEPIIADNGRRAIQYET